MLYRLAQLMHTDTTQKRSQQRSRLHCASSSSGSEHMAESKQIIEVKTDLSGYLAARAKWYGELLAKIPPYATIVVAELELGDPSTKYTLQAMLEDVSRDCGDAATEINRLRNVLTLPTLQGSTPESIAKEIERLRERGEWLRTGQKTMKLSPDRCAADLSSALSLVSFALSEREMWQHKYDRVANKAAEQSDQISVGVSSYVVNMQEKQREIDRLNEARMSDSKLISDLTQQVEKLANSDISAQQLFDTQRDALRLQTENEALKVSVTEWQKDNREVREINGQLDKARKDAQDKATRSLSLLEEQRRGLVEAMALVTHHYNDVRTLRAEVQRLQRPQMARMITATMCHTHARFADLAGWRRTALITLIVGVVVLTPFALIGFDDICRNFTKIMSIVDKL